MKLLQIPFSHNSIKVRRALQLKGLEFDAEDVNPVLRRNVRRISGQSLLPVLIDDGRAIADSTAILLYLEDAYPEPALLPVDRRERAECLMLEEWADATLMALARRLAYWSLIHSGASLGELFFPTAPRFARRLSSRPGAFAIRRRLGLSAERNHRDEREALRAARIALERLAGCDYLVGDRITIADIGLASMSLPLQIAAPAVREDDAVRHLVAWSARILDFDYSDGPSRLARS